MALVLFDVDGTLLDPPGSERRFIRHLLRSRRIGARQLGATLRFAWREAWRPGGAPKLRNKAYLDGMATAEVDDLGRRFAHRWLLPQVRPLLRARIADHLRAGDVTVLLTGTPEFLARPLADGLGIEHCIATRCAHAAGRYTDGAPLRHPYGITKLELARAFAAERGLDLGEAYAYADSKADGPLLAAVGHPVAVTPEPRLAATAIEQGWERLLS